MHRHSLRRVPLVAVGLLLAACGRRSEAPDARIVTIADAGFEAAASALHDPFSDLLFVASQGDTGRPGFVSALRGDGVMAAPRWLDGATDSIGLEHPFRMAVSGESFYVADGHHLRRFDRGNGAPGGTIDLPGGGRVADIAGGDAALYVAVAGSSGTDLVLRIDWEGRVDTVAAGDLGGPGGLAVQGDTVYLGNARGELLRIVGRGAPERARLPADSLTGVVALREEAFVATAAGAIYRGPVRGPFRLVAGGLGRISDLAHDRFRHQLIITDGGNAVRLLPLLTFP